MVNGSPEASFRGCADMADTPNQAPAPGTLQQVGRIAQFIFGLYMVGLNLLIIYLLIKIWPDKIPPADSTETFTAFSGKVHFVLSLEVRFLLITVLAGALGSYIHAA